MNLEKSGSGWIKCNVDGYFVKSDIQSKAGWVFRDAEGFIKQQDRVLDAELEVLLKVNFKQLLWRYNIERGVIKDSSSNMIV